ncbi:MAG: MCE family protein [Actinomycetota bacterium]|nr:MCE family protein [Actinomycetota bacterium]
MRLHKRVRIQLVLFIIIALVAGAVMLFGYVKLPALLFGVGRYTVTVELPEAGGIYESGNVTYSGTEVGRVVDVRLTDTGVEAVLSLKSNINIPSDLDAQVHSQSAIGEQYVALQPRNATAAPLKNGDVIPRNRTSVPPNINSVLDATNRGLETIPQDNLRTVIDESYIAIGGLGPDIARFVKGSTQLAIDARTNLDHLVGLIDQSQPVLDTQTDTAPAIWAWAANLAAITGGLRHNDAAVAGVLHQGPRSAEQARELMQRLQPSVPILMANLASVGEVALTYQPALEQILVLLPQGVANMQAGGIPNLNTKQDYQGAFLDFNLNLNLPPPCTTGFLPAQQRRSANMTDYPDAPSGDLYCRIPQDSMFNVRGARNYPCITDPGKRAPTARMCESDEQYVALNDGNNWKGDPNATLSGQDIPQLSADAPAPESTMSAAEPVPAPAPELPLVVGAQYDPATGTYLGPDGRVYTQSNLARSANGRQTWQTMLYPSEAGR